MIIKQVLLLLSIISFTLIHANTSLQPLTLSLPQYTIGHSLLVYEDTHASMDFTDIRKLPLSDFKSLNTDIGSHNFSDSAFWYQFKVDNSKNTPLTKLIVFEPAWLDVVNVMVVPADGKEALFKGGNTLNYDNRSLNHYLINFKPTFSPGISTVYVQVKTRDPFIVSISVLDESEFLSNELVNTLIIGFIYGGIIALLFYNLILFFGMKELYHGYYVMYLLLFLLMTASYNGYTFMYIFPTYPEIQNWLQSISIVLFGLAGLLFSRIFLNLRKHHSRLCNSTTFLIYLISLISILTAIFGGYSTNVFFSIISVIVVNVYIFSLAFYSWIHGNRSARFFLLGATSGLIGSTITSLTAMSILPYHYWTYKAADFGVFIDVILISVALSDRMKILQEKKVTAEEEANTDSLTGLLNRRAYYEYSINTYQDNLQNNNNFIAMMIDIDNFKTLNDTYGHQAGDTVLKTVSNIIKECIRDSDYIFRLGGDEFVLFLTKTDAKEAYILAEKIRNNIESINLNFINPNVQISSSLGIAQFSQEDASLESTVARADEALYQAKNKGKNKIEVYTKKVK